MDSATLPGNGGCLCGRVRLRIDAAPLLTMACHCIGCQRLTSSAFSLSAAIPAEGFAVVAGEPVIGALHGPSRHYFCPSCLSWMFTRPEGMDWFVNVRPTMLDRAGSDDAPWSTPFIETWTTERLAWATTPAVHNFRELPDLGDYDGLVAEFAEREGRAR